MKTMHLIAPRTGANNEGPNECLQCGAAIFHDDEGFEDGRGGATHITYDPALEDHTTDPATWDACGTPDMPEYKRCTG